MEKEKVFRPYIFMIDDSHILLMELAFRNALLIKASFRHLLVTYGNWRPTQWSNVSAIYAGHVLSSVSSLYLTKSMILKPLAYNLLWTEYIFLPSLFGFAHQTRPKYSKLHQFTLQRRSCFLSLLRGLRGARMQVQLKGENVPSH